VNGLQAALNGKANTTGPTNFTGTTTVANLTATGTVTIPNDSLTIARTSGLQAALDSKETRARFPITLGVGMTVPDWYMLGTLTLFDASAVRMCTLELTTQNPVGGFRAVVLRFSSNGGVFVKNTYDATPVAFNAHVQVQTTSHPSIYTLSSDLAVTQLSNTSYAFYVRIYPGVGTGFFSVLHTTGDSFTFEGVYTGTTRPAQGVHPDILAIASPDAIGAVPVLDPEVFGTLTCQDVAASGGLTVGGNSVINANLDLVSASSSRFLSVNAGITSWLMMRAPGLTAALMNDGNTFRMECQTLNKPMDFRVVNSSSVTLTPLQLYSNGVVNVGGNVTNNKVLVLYDFAPTASPATVSYTHLRAHETLS
jgi:hypothetical protein